MTPDELLAGPRGRRLCLELARATVSALPDGHADAVRWRDGVFWAGVLLSPPSDAPRVVLYAPTSPGEDASAPPPEPSRDGVVTDALDAIARVPLPELTAAMLLEAVTEAVDAAMYWQAPNGDDVLAAMPDARAGLRRFAALVTDSPHSEWWSRGVLDTPQFAVVWDPLEPAPAAPAAEPTELPLEDLSSYYAGFMLTAWRAERRAVEARSVAELQDDPEGSSGEWWSFPPAGALDTTASIPGFGPAGLYLKEDSHGWEAAAVVPIEPHPASRVFRITGTEDWAALCAAYPLDVSAQMRYVWGETTGRIGAWVMPDWARVGERWDAVHLGVDGYLSSAGRAIDCGNGRGSVIAGWGPGATYWLSDVVRPGDGAERWTRSEPETHVNVHAWARVVTTW